MRSPGVTLLTSLPEDLFGNLDSKLGRVQIELESKYIETRSKDSGLIQSESAIKCCSQLVRLEVEYGGVGASSSFSMLYLWYLEGVQE